MKQLLFISFLSTGIVWAIAQPPRLDDINENTSVIRQDTTVAEGTHTTVREREGLPEDSSKTVKNSKKVVHKSHSERRTSASTKSNK